MDQQRTRAGDGQGTVVDLGRQPYERTLAQMRELAATIRAGDADGKILLVEHDPVYTAGRAAQREPLPVLPPPDVVVPIERGGRITWHGPGQLVVYPVLRLQRHDLRRWLTALEDFGIAWCAEFGLPAQAAVDGTGVFVQGRKIASIGVAVRHWINLHGIALNVATGTEAWRRIRPCGLDPALMTDLSRELGRPTDLDAARAAAHRHLPGLFAAAGGA